MHQRVNETPFARAQRLAGSEHGQNHKKAAEVLEGVTIPENKYWDELEESYMTMYQGIVRANQGIATQLEGVTSDPVKRERILDQGELALLTTAVTSDIQNALARLDAIRAMHADKTGGATTNEDLVKIMEIGELYDNALRIHNDTVVPASAKILELLNNDRQVTQEAISDLARQADSLEYMAIENHKDATNVNKITDVVPRTPGTDNNS